MAKYIYICSAAHAGSTILDVALGSHKDMIGIGEIVHLSRVIERNTSCTCKKPVLECPLWSAVIGELEEKTGKPIRSAPHSFFLGYFRPKPNSKHTMRDWLTLAKRRCFNAIWYFNKKYGLGLRKLDQISEKIAENTFLLYDIVLLNAGKKLLVDSSKSYAKSIEMYLRRPNDVRIIFLVRDGKAVFYSGLKRKLSKRRALSNFYKYYPKLKYLIDRFVRPEHVLYVKYEDFTSSPEKELNRICSFLGIDFDPFMMEPAHTEHHILNANTLASQATQIRPDTSWTNKLSSNDLAYFNKYAQDINRLLGY
jgi:hypothetical protein